jgi:integrase
MYLSRANVRALEPAATVYRVYDIEARRLCVKVYPSATKVWQYIYTFQRRARFMTLGSISDLDVKAARQKAHELGGIILAGKDPQAEHMSVKSTDTFRWLMNEYYCQYAIDNLRGAGQTRYLIDKYLSEKFHGTPVHQITRRDVKAVVAPLMIKTPGVAKQLLAAMSSVFTWGVEEAEVLSVNPCARIKRPKYTARSRVLSDTEIVQFWREFEKCGTVGVALKLLLLTGQRPGEVAYINRRHIRDGCWWQMPGEAERETWWHGTKNGVTHQVFLVDAALQLLAAGDGDDEARARRSSDPGDEPMGAIFSDPYRLIHNMQRAMRNISSQLGVERATPHDLRRSHGTTVCRLLGFGGIDAMNRIQNHREGGVGSIYNQHAYAEEKKRAMELVAAHFMALIEGRPAADNVVSLLDEARRTL